jgi:hypothetical protein
MTLSPTPEFDFPPGRLAQRRDHLVAEIAASTAPARRSRHLRVAIAFGLLVLAGTVVNVAFGLDLGGRFTDLVAGKDAPGPIEERLVDEATAKRIVPFFAGEFTVDAEAAHGVMAIETALGPVALWAVTTREGPICTFVETVSRSEAEGRPAGKSRCAPRPSPPGPIDWWRVRDSVRGRAITLVAGVVHESVASVSIETRDGARRRLELAERFFLADVSNVQGEFDLVARDSAGREFGQRRTVNDFTAGFQELFSLKEAGPPRTVIATRDHKGRPLKLTLRPAEGGLVCKSIGSGSGRSGTCVPTEQLRVDEGMSVHPTLAGSIVYLEGSVGPEVETLTLEYEDGSVVEVPIVERFVLFSIARENFFEGAQPRLLVAKDAEGREVARGPVGQRVFGPKSAIWLPGDVSI